MNQKERMLNGLPYKAWLDGLEEEREICKQFVYELNVLPPKERGRIPELLKKLIGKTGENVWIEPPFHCDYGWNIEVGNNFFANYNCTIIDVAKVIIGDNCQMAPNVSIYTAGHPLHPAARNTLYEYGIEVVIGDNVWIGGNVMVIKGAEIGSGSVIGAKSLVKEKIEDYSVAVGIPAKVIRLRKK